MKRWYRSVILLLTVAAAFLTWETSVGAYTRLGWRWPRPTTVYYMGLVGVYGTLFEQAMADWNDATPNFHFSLVRRLEDPCDRFDGENGVAFKFQLCDDGNPNTNDNWGDATLAVTSTYYTSAGFPTDQNILFNSNKSWDVSNSNLPSFPSLFIPLCQPNCVYDFKRVAQHELGHALGLDHEDSVPSIMTTNYGSYRVPQPDDLEGVRVIYSGKPSTPKLTAPSDKFNGVAFSPELSWETTTGAESYTLFLSTTNPPSQLTVIPAPDYVPKGSVPLVTYRASNLANNRTYYWYVEADNKYGYTTSPIYSFVVSVPDPPSSLDPADGTTDVAPSARLSWSHPDSSALFDLYLGTQSNPPIFYLNLTSREVYPPGLNFGTTYYWRVVAKVANGGSTSSPILSFRTSPALPPPVPQNLAPANNAVGVTNTNLTLTWGISTGATGYDVYFGNTDNPPKVGNNVACCGFRPNGGQLNIDVKYYWRVASRNSFGANSSPLQSFTTGALPGSPSPISPADNASGVSLFPILSWTAAARAITYDVYFGTSTDPGLAVVGTKETQFRFGPLPPNTKFYWKLAARNDLGNTYTFTFSFTTSGPQPPSAPQGTGPADGATSVSLTPTLSWNPAVGADTYRVFLGTGPNTMTRQTETLVHSYTAAALAPGQTYYWSVVAHNGTGDTSSPVYRFTTVPPTSKPQHTGDFDGDSKAELAVYRPSTGVWWILRSSSGFTSLASYGWGAAGDVPISGDFDGDGKTDVTVYRPSTGEWWILKSSTGYTTNDSLQWGVTGDVPVPGDFDGDGKTDVAVYRPSTGAWWILKSSTGYTSQATYGWGATGDVPISADFDGDGKADIAVYRPSTGGWWILKSSTGYTTYDSYQWGVIGDIPVPGDFDGDGKADVAVYRPSMGVWWILRSSSGFTSLATYGWGATGDVPISADFDGDGKADVAVYRPSTGGWWILKSSTGFASFSTYQWGLSGDVPAFTGR